MSLTTFLVMITLSSLSTYSIANTTERVFSQATLISQQSEENKHYLLPLGRVKLDRSAGRDLPTKYKRLSGDYSAIVWQITSGISLQEAQDQVNEFVADPHFDMLFQCSSRDCGVSFSWANSVFEKPILYGSDRNQSMWVVKDKGARRYHLFYLIERPNRHLYFYEETLYVPDLVLDENVIRTLLQREGRVVLGEILLQDGKADVTALVDRVAVHAGQVTPELLVIHRHGAQTRDLKLTSLLSNALKKAGIQGVHIEDVANLAPRSDAPGEIWVEWVNPNWVP
jgi:hypothetical protein